MILTKALTARLEAEYERLCRQAVDAFKAGQRATARGDIAAAELAQGEARDALDEANTLRTELEAAGAPGPFPPALTQPSLWRHH